MCPNVGCLLNLIAAASENMGIGINGRLPWTLKNEMAFFTKITTNTKDNTKKNVVIMGRRTWECIPKKYRPLAGRINIVLTRGLLNLKEEAIVCKSIPAALEIISQPPLSEKVETIWVIGGNSVYKAAMETPNFHRLYLTQIKKYIECDTFFPSIPKNFAQIDTTDVPKGIQEENGIQYEYKVYEKF
ncbi:hypothetical protein PV327_007300 [Microctonus hyperodae]|uniref:dihydrofolate reductase n=1 Tax=Microctonus hyperodae TaxID=165561 RepID=A0AA39F633_MICHY|nr:hypothetical protein PV327_007300 [Microctonus hyperodae]